MMAPKYLKKQIYKTKQKTGWANTTKLHLVKFIVSTPQ